MEKEYLGTYEIGEFDRNRIKFPKELRQTLYSRRGRYPNLYCLEENEKNINFLSFWEKRRVQEGIGKEVKISKKFGTIIIPRNVNPLEGELVMVGAGECFEVFRKNDWNKIMTNENFEEIAEKIFY